MAAKSQKLTALVEYQDGSIVSRQVVRKKTGNVTLFAFDKGQGLSEHTAPFDAMVHVLDGEAQVTVGGKPLRLKDGDFVVMPADVPHSLKAVKRFKMLLIMIRS